tara:strand:+ start:644 stop:1078 length:435 start_codon:yes stop_codon:yes gene_type:complete
MILKYIKKKDKEMGETNEEKLIKVASLLVHAARIDDNYSEKEKLIILNFLKSYNNEKENLENIIKKAEEDEKKSNQILEYTKEIKNNTLEFRSKIVKVLWEIILSDDSSDMYETNLIRRVCGLLYLPDKISGEIKLEILRKKKL